MFINKETFCFPVEFYTIYFMCNSTDYINFFYGVVSMVFFLFTFTYNFMLRFCVKFKIIVYVVYYHHRQAVGRDATKTASIHLTIILYLYLCCASDVHESVFMSLSFRFLLMVSLNLRRGCPLFL